MKIVYVNTLGIWGGVATYLETLIKDQVNRGNDVYLIVGNEGDLTKYVRKNFPSVKITVLDSMKREVDILGTLTSIVKMRKIIKKINPDIIHLNCIMAGLIGRIANIGMKNKVVYNAHGWAFEPGTSKKYKFPAIVIERILAYLTDKIICVSDYEYNIAKKYKIFRDKSQGVVIKNCSKDFKVQKKADTKTFNITMAARFWKQKNQLLLLKSFKELLSMCKKNQIKKQIQLYLLGDGPTLDECKKYVSENGLSNNVIFTGRVDNVRDYYGLSDVVTLITNYDAIAISLIEALSMGKPLVASNVSGVPENFSENINGYLVPNDSQSISDALYKIIINGDLEKEMSVNSRNLYIKEFTEDKNSNMHNDCYTNLVNKI